MQAFPGGSEVKNLPASSGDTRESVWSLGREDPLEEEMTTHSSIPAWETPQTKRSLVGYSPRDCNELETAEVTFTQQLCWSPGVQQGEVLKLLVWGIGCPACGQPDFVSYLNSGEVI